MVSHERNRRDGVSSCLPCILLWLANSGNDTYLLNKPTVWHNIPELDEKYFKLYQDLYICLILYQFFDKF